MTSTRLAEAVLRAIMRAECGGERPAVADAPRYSVTSPVFGKVDLVPHDPSTPPLAAVALVYVATSDAPDKLTLAMWAGGEWKTRGMRPLGKPVRVWYSTEGGCSE